MPQTIVFYSLQAATVRCHSMSLMVFVWRHVHQMSLVTTPLASVNCVSACHFHEIYNIDTEGKFLAFHAKHFIIVNIYQFNNLLAFMDTDSLIPRLPCSRMQTLKLCSRGEPSMSYPAILFKALILLVNILYTTICAYAPLPLN